MLVTRSRRTRSSLANSYTTTVATIITLPSVIVELTKPDFDGLQLWADDVSRLLEASSRSPASASGDAECATDQGTNLIGSRYFSRPRRTLSSTETRTDSQQNEEISEVVVKLSVAKGASFHVSILWNKIGLNVEKFWLDFWSLDNQMFPHSCGLWKYLLQKLMFWRNSNRMGG